MEIFIVRHAIAMDRDEFKLTGLDDSQRPLTEGGEKKFKKIAEALKPLIDSVDVILSSPYARAQQTAQLLAVHFPKIELQTSIALIPSSNPNEFAKWCKDHLKKKTKSIIIVGHEPHLSILTSWLVFGCYQSKVKIKKGGCLSITTSGPVGAESGILNWALTPKCLRLS